MKRVAILGCGPAGLLAAEAAERRGATVTIFSRKVKSPIFGAQYLHRIIPHVTSGNPDFTITVLKSGTKQGYAKLVYGDPDMPVSWQKFDQGQVFGWDMRHAYDKLWDRWEDSIEDMTLGALQLNGIGRVYDRVFSTIPANKICLNPNHVFKQQPIWVLHGQGNEELLQGDLMYYNGFPPDGSVGDTIGPDWYRYSQLRGYQSWEFSRQLAESYDESKYQVSTGFKPIHTTCDCWPKLTRIGRYGRWERGVLTHHAYQQVLDALQ